MSTPKNLVYYNLRNNGIEANVFKEVDGCSNIKIDYKNKLLFVSSEERGLLVFDISVHGIPRFLRNINVKHLLNIDNLNLTDINVMNGFIFLSLRSVGIVRLDYQRDQNTFTSPQIIRKIQKVQLEDPQETKYNSKNNILYIADGIKGIVLLNTENNDVLSEKLLPDNDKPKRIILFQNNAIIQGSKGLYYYNVHRNEISTIINYKIGSIAKYYNHLIVSKSNNIQLVNIGRTSSEISRTKYNYFSKIYDYTDNRTIEI